MALGPATTLTVFIVRSKAGQGPARIACPPVSKLLLQEQSYLPAAVHLPQWQLCGLPTQPVQFLGLRQRASKTSQRRWQVSCRPTPAKSFCSHHNQGD